MELLNESVETLLMLAKKHLRVDYEDDDSYILFLCKAAAEYICDAVDQAAIDCENNHQRLILLFLVIITDMYEHRSMSFEATGKVQYTIRSIISQLQAG